mmetsp:Transcript_18480/g.33019  ORF Transcript_18480/g.33019 Transcript_18480/m.33019 type:complete len:295 (+) Transcript_18480:74-958(+)|eukprot:CAMPEP_0196133146 /NCGR_PEP_ID=MMETSP0910-20130528/2489_1 /TAXON_ID=49265 /ORGANISM="Thalassiosira rotula, Strain GSO102" /LENGTH=294 /DNA_ID=CAMNT_0041392841 /DNA_START=72 /DNA_END=956 /DNA_ORIENTATION=+
MSLPSTSIATTIIRPLTSYHLFSQLEREYILQKLLGFTPTVTHTEVFKPTNYPHIPPLPTRYDDIILLWDWHLPGKTKRRKRKHRKSHGKIGFQELNERISQAWSAVDDEVRNFCEILSEIEGRKYKKNKREERKKQRKSKIAKGKKSSKRNINADDCMFDWTVDIDTFPHDNFPLDDIFESTMFSRIASFNEISLQSRDVGDVVEVDMSDDEIIHMWRSVHTENDFSSTLSKDQMCMVTSFRASYPYPHDEDRKSFIDAEYEMYQNIGKEFNTKTKKQRLPSLRRKTISACQA